MCRLSVRHKLATHMKSFMLCPSDFAKALSVQEKADDRDSAITSVSRRSLIGFGVATAATLMLPSSLPAMSQRVKMRSRIKVAATARGPAAVRPELFAAALGALERHGDMIRKHDRIAIADFGLASSEPRLHIVNIGDGRAQSLLVAHGSGSDPDHTGWLKRFSNDFDSNASSRGAFATADYYVGKHGHSQRLVGLDPSNSNAFDRAIVVHGAWYANKDMLASHGKLGRSQGCFAVGEQALEKLFDHLGKGRMLYAAKA